MKKAIIGFIIGGLMGAISGGGAMLVVYPFLFPPVEVNETTASIGEDNAQLLAESTFREGVSGQDAGHWGKGGIKTYRAANGEILLELQGNFEVGPGPNFWLYLNTAPDINDESDFQSDAGRVKLAKLKSFTGSQIYRASAQQYQKAKSLTIWCETFNQYIASANLPE